MLGDTLSPWSGVGTHGQAGAGSHRLYNEYHIGAVWKVKHSEMVYYSGKIDQVFAIIDTVQPLEGDAHTYATILDPTTGRFDMYYDGQNYQSYEDSLWIGHEGNFSTWAAEVQREDSDIAGTQNAPFFITNCFILTAGGTFQHTPINLLFSFNDDIGEFDTLISGDTIYIWDKNPLP
jgi:hypothetical protein